MTTTFGRCAQPVELFGALQPMHDDSLLTPRGISPVDYRDWVEAAKAPLNATVANAVVAWFSEAEGIASKEIGDDEVPYMTWLIESPRSPLYVSVDGVRQLLSVLQSATESPLTTKAEIVRENVLTYLYWLTEGRSSGSWLTEDRRRGFFAENSGLLGSAWRTIVAVPYQHRSLSGLRKLRQGLIKASMREELLTLPDWLVE